MNKSFRLLAAVGLCAAMATGTAWARGNEKHEHGKAAAWKAHERGHERERHERRVFERRHESKRPPGWDHGRKTGWGDCNVPPGQAKKAGCTPAAVRHDRVRHDRRWEERRREERRRIEERREAQRRAAGQQYRERMEAARQKAAAERQQRIEAARQRAQARPVVAPRDVRHETH